MRLLNAALKYESMGFSVIPVKRNKKPFIAWTEYQKRKATQEEIKNWWQKWPDANIGIVTGAISGLTVVDIDSTKGREAIEEITPENFTTCMASTPSGGEHRYCKYQEGISNSTRFITDCDVRSEGGYIVAPPSRGPNGKPYAWMPGLSIEEMQPAALPGQYINIINKHLKGGFRGEKVEGDNAHVLRCPQMSSDVLKEFQQGARDETLFRLANYLVKGGMDEENLLKYLYFFGINCNPPFPKKEIIAKIQSAFQRAKKLTRNLTQEVRDFVLSSNGLFLSSDVLMSLQLSSRQERKNVSNILARLLEEEIIERAGNRNGCFRRIENEIEEMDFHHAETESIDVWLPFNIHRLVEMLPGNTILLAGDQNAGKTGILLNIIRQNMHKFEIHYFNSEMGASELKKRLQKFEDIRLEDWKFKAWVE